MGMKMKIENLKLKIVWLLVFVFDFSAFSAEPNDINAINLATGHFWQDLKSLPKVSLEDAQKTYFNSNNLLLILMAGGGSIALHDKADDTIAGHFERHRSFPQDLDKITEWTGSPAVHFGATGIWYLMASKRNDNLNIQRSWIMARALTVTGATTLILKGIVNNDTPNGKELAWPSGHTASSFCVASVLDEFYGSKVGIPAYLLAGFVGYRMMDSGDHWASDVLFGGVLGYVVGHAVAGENKKLELAGFQILPLVAPERNGTTAGVTLAKQF